MKKLYITLTFFIALSIITLCATAQGIWTKMATFPGAPRFYDAGFSIGHYGFIGCGEDNVYNSQYFDFYKWNQTTNTWSAITDYPGEGTCVPITASIDGYGYVGLGFDIAVYSPQQDLWRYDTTNNTWTQMASIPGTGRYDAGFFTIGHKIYVIGGSTGGPPYLDDAWVYDAHLNTWTQLNTPPSAGTANLVAFSLGNHGYVGGGWDGNSVQSACWEYDTTTDTWTSIASLPVGVWADPRAFVLCGKAYLCTGLYNVPAPYYTLPVGYVYDTISKAWTEFTNMGENGIERGHAAAFTIGNYGYIGTGQDSIGDYLNDYWQYGDTSNIALTPSTPNICEGDSVQLSASGGGSTYFWEPAIGLSATTGDSVFASPTITTTYTVATAGNCLVSAATNIVTVISPPDTPRIIQHGDTLISTAKQGNQWARNDTLLQGVTNQTYIITITGWYKVVTANPANGCSSTSDSGYYSPTGINQLTVESGQVTVYPNPTGGEINLDISLSVGELKDWYLQITDVLGRTVYARQSLNYNDAIDLSKLSSGVYFICVVNKTGRFVVPVVKQ